jgi:hypothetical protein
MCVSSCRGEIEGEGLTGDRDSAEATALLDLKHVVDGVVGREHDGVGDEAVFVALDAPDHRGLGRGALVVVDDADAAVQLGVKKYEHTERRSYPTTHRHRDRHLGLGDGVHRGAHERRLEDDVAGDPALRRDDVRGKVDVAGQHEEVVVREPAMANTVHELVHGEAIAAVVRLEVRERGGGGERSRH